MANKSILQKIFGKSALAEVIVRHLYWHNVSILHKLKKAIASPSKKATEGPGEKINFDEILETWKSWGLKPGDILILTSSTKELGLLNVNAMQLIDKIIAYLGEEGTLAMPGFPHFKDSAPVEEYLTFDNSNEVYDYDVKRSAITTGMLPGILARYKGAVRSSYPINTLIAIGKYANEMFSKERFDMVPLPCGKGSAWEFCYLHNAKVISLGVDLAHSITMIHAAEDLIENTWPIKNWYRTRKFRITKNGETTEVSMKERQPKWGALYFAERKLSEDLLQQGIAKAKDFGSIETEFVESKPMLEFLFASNKNGYPYYFIPKKHHKN